MARDDHGLAEVTEGSNHVAELDPRRRVEARGGLVEEEEVGIVDQGLGEEDALLPALGEVGHLLLAPLSDSGQLDGSLNSLTAHDPRQPIGDGEELEELLDREALGHPEGVGHEAQHLADAIGLLLGAMTPNPDSACVGLVHGGQHSEGRRLTGAVGAYEAIDGALLDLEVEALDGRGAAIEAPHVAGDEGTHAARSPREERSYGWTRG